MLPTIQRLVQHSICLMLSCAALSTLRAAERPEFHAGPGVIQILRIKPSEGDRQRIQRHLDSQGRAFNGAEDQVHVVKIHVTMPPPGAVLQTLYIGDKKIEEYGEFEGGIFFKTYNVKDLSALRGKPVRFVEDEAVVASGITFPASFEARADANAADLPDIRDALRTPKGK